jgi:hypothetical protein
MDKIGERLNPKAEPAVKVIKLESGQIAKEYENYLFLPNKAVVEVIDPSNPQNPVYDPDKIYFAQKYLSGAKFGPTRTGSWIEIHNPTIINNLQKIVGSQN